MVTYSNDRNGDVVVLPVANARLDRLPNWHRLDVDVTISVPEGDERSTVATLIVTPVPRQEPQEPATAPSSPTTAPESTEAPAVAPEQDLSEMTVKELRALAKAEGIDLTGATKKATIIDAIVTFRDARKA